jgi:hypothetical protein
MKVVYVAGPYRAPTPWGIEQNIRRAEALSLEVWKLGAAAICPHANTRYFQHEAPDDIWLKGDLAILEKCDAVLLTPDWRKSEGATVEAHHARNLGIPVFIDLEELVEFLCQSKNP